MVPILFQEELEIVCQRKWLNGVIFWYLLWQFFQLEYKVLFTVIVFESAWKESTMMEVGDKLKNSFESIGEYNF